MESPLKADQPSTDERVAWMTIECAALTEPILHAALSAVRDGVITRDQALIRTILTLVEQNERLKTELLAWLSDSQQAVTRAHLATSIAVLRLAEPWLHPDVARGPASEDWSTMMLAVRTVLSGWCNQSAPPRSCA